MTSDENSEPNISLTVPVGAAVGALVLAVAATVAYVLMGRGNESSESTASNVTSSGRNMLRRMGILGLVAVLENDATRKVILAALKAIARRG